MADRNAHSIEILLESKTEPYKFGRDSEEEKKRAIKWYLHNNLMKYIFEED